MQVSNLLPPGSSAEVMKTRFPQTAGEECPLPGKSNCQSQSFSVHWSGIWAMVAAPAPLGPRKRGQLSVAIDKYAGNMQSQANEQTPNMPELDFIGDKLRPGHHRSKCGCPGACPNPIEGYSCPLCQC